ncbi:MAG TPA: translation initiation factor IF-2 [Caldithrix abyssi]|uniref:Translation initiation factor IF-2 n=1 Tax=Caldithrix abyssi TaxID=187145 RepID=A0A7V5RQB4_CALAY|nr:translation initiation factor IF-2 [Caldithrix abyssi]
MAAAKKYKLFKICKELNVGHETISQFLVEKGVKVSGPNSAVSEEDYLEIVERFATDKAKAEKRREKKSLEAEEKAGAPSEAAAEKPSEAESDYLKAIKESIEVRAEELSKPEPEPEPKPKPRAKKPAGKKEQAGEEPKTVEPVSPKEPEKEQAPAPEKPARPVIRKQEPYTDPTKRPKPAPAKMPVAETPPRHESKKKKEKAPEVESLSEKEKKRQKALEMIRKDGKKKASKKPDLRVLGIDGDGAARKRKSKKQKRKNVDAKAVQDTLKKTLASLDTKARKPKYKKKVKEVEGELIEEKVIEVTEFISANDLANLMDVPVSEILMKCLELGLVVSINQRLDLDTIQLLAEEYGYKVEEHKVTEFVDDEEEEEEDDPALLEPRPPIVTIMGHVDHGKTSLLDYLRESNVAGGEAGGITQHVGAYEVDYQGKKITFLDTPGHEAFTAMRARGAQVTDIVILIIAADDAVMPQTDEALDHAKAAGVKIVIAINKIDKPGANPERIKQQLSERNVLVEDWGGTYQCAEISAKTGKGIPELLEKVLLESELLELKANPNKMAQGFVIESRLDKGKGPIATVLIQSGTLRVGDNFVTGQYHGKVRAILDERDQKMEKLSPGQPGLVVGFTGVPQAGDRFVVRKDERSAREIATKRQQLHREQEAKTHRHKTLAQISEQIKMGETQELNIVVKADVDGSAEALSDALIKLNTQEVEVNVVRKAVGPISEGDVLLASASNAVIIGFHVRANAKAKELAAREGVDIHIYRVVYDAINDIRLALEGMLRPEENEVVLGHLEVRETFKVSRVGTIAGCYVTDGKILRQNKVRIIRDDVEIYTGNIASLKRFKDDVKEVASGFECGVQIENYNDLKVGDVIESFEITQTKRKLENV